MRTFNVVIERDPDTGLFVGHVPGWPGAHSQGESLDELQTNLQEVVRMLLEDGEPKFESEFVAVQPREVIRQNRLIDFVIPVDATHNVDVPDARL
jgi:predicted RNase H-like HicB family nuclease